MADPPKIDEGGLEESGASVNDRLLAQAIRHALYLERLKTHEVNRIVGFLNDEVFPDLTAKLQARLAAIQTRGFDKGPATTQRLRDLHTAVRGLIAGGVKSAGKTLQKDLAEIAVSEAEWQAARLNETTPLGVDFVTPSPKTVRAVVTGRPMQGRLLKQWVADVGVATARRVEQEIGLGIVQGETTDQIVRRVAGTKAKGFTDGVLDVTRREAEALVRTAVGHVSNQAREATYEENADIVESVILLETLDLKTCFQCAALDRDEYPIGEGPRPPHHYGCRGTTISRLKSAKELGLNMKELPESTRASMKGQVPERMTFEEFAEKKLTPEEQQQWFGPGRYKLWKAGKISLSDLVSQRGRPLNLKQLRALGH